MTVRSAERALDQIVGRGVELLAALVGRLGHFLAEFDAELVERIDAEQHAR